MRSLTLALASAAAALALPAMGRADLPAGLTYDDGYAWFSVDTITDTQNGKPYAKGWMLTAQLRILGQVPDHSAFKLLVKKAGAVVATIQDDGSIYRYKPPVWTDRPDCMFDDALRDREQIVKGEGPFQVEVYYIQGDDLSEHLVRTHVIDVEKVTRVRGNTNEPDAPQYYINRHGEASVAVMYQRPAKLYPYAAGPRPDTYGYNVVELYFGTSASDQGGSLGTGYTRTTVDGEPLDLTPYQQFTTKDQVTGGVASDRQYEVIHTAAGNVKESVNFREYRVMLPFTWGAKGDPARYYMLPSITDHPGRWEVSYIVNGRVVRTWRFTVDAEGNLAPHPEEQHGLTFAPGAHLVEMVIPPGGAYIDARLVPDQAKVGGLYGHAWQSDEMKAAAAAIPAKGTPAP